MKLHALEGNTYYLDMGYSCVGVYMLSKHEAVMIDSGFRRDPELFEWLESGHIRISAVFCTHLHVDHVANNYELQERYGTKIYASQTEIDTANRQHWSIWPQGKEGELTPIEGADAELSWMRTPGHTMGHISLGTPDGVFFLGDTMIAPRILCRSKLPYMTDIRLAEESMRRIDETSYSCYLAAHKGAMNRQQLHTCVEQNLQKEEEILAVTQKLIDRPMTIKAAVDRILTELDVSAKAKDSFAIHYTTKARINCLTAEGKLIQKDGYVYPASGEPAV